MLTDYQLFLEAGELMTENMHALETVVHILRENEERMKSLYKHLDSVKKERLSKGLPVFERLRKDVEKSMKKADESIGYQNDEREKGSWDCYF